MNQKGQVVLILVLVMTVALAIGISVIQRSLSDVSTASLVEQSSRAFSAAEAGIEKALKGNYPGPVSDIVNFFVDNSSKADLTENSLKPALPSSGNRQEPLEYPPMAKEETGHIWLADPAANLPTCAASDVCYKQTMLDIYWGDSVTDKAALELTLVYHDGSKYVNRKWFLDNRTISPPRTPANNFDTNANCGGFTIGSNSYQCKYTIGGANSGVPDPGGSLPSSGMMLIRTRLLYNNNSQPLAVQAVGTCGQDCSIPTQARTLVSIGTAGKAQRKIRLFQIDKVVPPYFDYAVFSVGVVNK